MMKRIIASVCLTLFLVITLLGALSGVAYAAGEDINLTPDSGFAFITITGTGFTDMEVYPRILFTWDWPGGVPSYPGDFIPTYPEDVRVGQVAGTLIAFAGVPTPNSVGVHTIQTWGWDGDSSPFLISDATATFTVVDMTGPQGIMGIDGLQGLPGIQGPPGEQGPPGNEGIGGIGIRKIENNGDGTFTIYLSDGNTFTTDNLTGPQGEPGPPGETGAQGEQGPQGETGETGEMGPAGGLSVAAITLSVGAIGWMGFGVLKKLLLK